MSLELQQRDVVEYAKSLVRQGKDNLETDGELDPVAVVIYGRETQVFPLDFSSDVAKTQSLREVHRFADSVKAGAAGVMFTAKGSEVESSSSVSAYRALVAVFKGPCLSPFVLEIPFQMADGEVMFLDMVENHDGVQISLLPDWY